MGRSRAVAVVPFLTFVLAAQAPGTVRDAALRQLAPAMPLPEVALTADADFALAGCGLGDGGVGAGERGELRWRDDGGVTTPGGVHVECRSAGVKLSFPSGRELLVAPDGHVHLRSGEHAGPFAAGLELWLGDGTTVRVSLAASNQQRLRDVTVGDGERRLQPWRRGEPSHELARGGWSGMRFLCCGDGGDLYRAIALGPLLVLDRTLVAAERADTTPRERLVVLGAALVQSLRTMQRQHREPDPVVRGAMTTIGELATRSGAWLPEGALLRRAERDALRWVAKGGFELAIERDGPLAPRLQLFSGRRAVPIVEWTLHGDAAAFLTNPRDDQAGKRWHGNGTRLPRVVPELQAREQLFERGLALQVLERMLR